MKTYAISDDFIFRKDVKLSDDENDGNDVKPSTSSWVHRNLQKIHKVHASKASKYDPNERNPLFAGAELSNQWELSTLAEHFHPSAALFGKTLLEGEQVSVLKTNIHNYVERLGFCLTG
jgi:ribosome biogenesis protein MAK21